jgi:hypothetical protein
MNNGENTNEEYSAYGEYEPDEDAYRTQTVESRSMETREFEYLVYTSDKELEVIIDELHDMMPQFTRKCLSEFLYAAREIVLDHMVGRGSLTVSPAFSILRKITFIH